jgi:hypothetical protein
MALRSATLDAVKTSMILEPRETKWQEPKLRENALARGTKGSVDEVSRHYGVETKTRLLRHGIGILI